MWEFWKSKTFWTALAGLIASIGGYIAGEINLQTLYLSLFAVLSVIFMRHGIAKIGK